MTGKSPDWFKRATRAHTTCGCLIHAAAPCLIGISGTSPCPGSTGSGNLGFQGGNAPGCGPVAGLCLRQKHSASVIYSHCALSTQVQYMNALQVQVSADCMSFKSKVTHISYLQYMCEFTVSTNDSIVLAVFPAGWFNAKYVCIYIYVLPNPAAQRGVF